MKQKNYSRTSRHLSQETRNKISKSLTGRPKTIAHKEAIRQGELRYWRDDANFPDDIARDDKKVSVEDLVL